MDPRSLPGAGLSWRPGQGAGGQWTEVVLGKRAVHWHELQGGPREKPRVGKRLDWWGSSGEVPGVRLRGRATLDLELDLISTVSPHLIPCPHPHSPGGSWGAFWSPLYG